MITRAPRISKKKQNALLHAFAELDIDATTAAKKYAKVHRRTADLYYRHFREVIYQASRKAPRFFGEIEMDQAEFGGRGVKRLRTLLERYKKILPYKEYMEKAKLARKEHKIMVFGILQRGGNVYCHIITKADKRTLQPIVRLVVEPDSTIYTDKWRGFGDLGIDMYKHKSVNHSEEYVAKDGTHINGIESFWWFAKRRLIKFNGVSRTTLPLHIKECEFRFNNKGNVSGALKKLLKQ